MDDVRDRVVRTGPKVVAGDPNVVDRRVGGYQAHDSDKHAPRAHDRHATGTPRSRRRCSPMPASIATESCTSRLSLAFRLFSSTGVTARSERTGSRPNAARIRRPNRTNGSFLRHRSPGHQREECHRRGPPCRRRSVPRCSSPARTVLIARRLPHQSGKNEHSSRHRLASGRHSKRHRHPRCPESRVPRESGQQPLPPDPGAAKER